MDEDQKQYEAVFILPPQLETEDLENVKKEIQEIIAKFEGKIEFKGSQKKDLAYPINKQGQGLFLVGQLSISLDNVNSFSKELKLNKQILRHLITQLPSLKPETKKPRLKKTIKKPSYAPALAKATADKKAKEAKEKKVKFEEIDKKLDEIIEEI